MKQPGAIQLIAIALILGTGLGMLWGFGLGAVGSWFVTTGIRDYEEIVVDAEGTAYIRVRVGGNYDNLRHRTLQGEAVELSEANTFFATGIGAPYRAPQFFEYPIPWRSRIAGINAFGKPPISWVMIRDDNRPGRVYVVGHDPESNQVVGYLGRKGFRTSLPPVDEQFIVGNFTFQYDSNAYATTGYINTGGLGSRYNAAGHTEENVLQPWLVYLCDGDAVQEINIRTGAVRLVKEFDGLVGIAVATSEEANIRGSLDGRRRPTSRLLVRTRDSMRLHDVFTGSETSFKIPPDLVNTSFRVNTVGSEQLILHVNRGKWERGNVVELLTIDSEGNVQQQETVQLVWITSPDGPYFALIPACLVPVLFGWLAGMFLVAPLLQLQEYRVATFAAGVQVAWDTAWMGLVLVFVFSVILTTIVYNWQQKYSRPNTALWTTFVLLTTLPGFLAYWVMHRREPMGACVHCGAMVPQDREACAKCAAQLPEPKLLGTEIFA